MDRRTFLKLLGGTAARLVLPFKAETEQEPVVGAGWKSPAIADNLSQIVGNECNLVWEPEPEYDPGRDIEWCQKEWECHGTVTLDDMGVRLWATAEECDPIVDIESARREWLDNTDWKLPDQKEYRLFGEMLLNTYLKWAEINAIPQEQIDAMCLAIIAEYDVQFSETNESDRVL